MDASGLPTSLRVAGAAQAPRKARLAVLSALEGQISARIAGDVGVIVSELVTNSVRHADVGADDAVIVDVLRSEIACGLRSSTAGLSGSCTSSGVAREGEGVTRVWCELALGTQASDRSAS